VRVRYAPARYSTDSFGDIFVPCDPAPMDLSGWFKSH
jgi:hypothetical protein